MRGFLLTVALIAAGLALLASLGDGAPSAAADVALSRRPIVAETEMSPIADTLVARADFSAGSTFKVPPPRLESAKPVVVALHLAEREAIEEGDLLASVGGRPMFAFDGPIPMYRAVLPYDVGPDIEFIQHGLVRSGYLDPDTQPDGIYGKATMHAVEQLYRASGFEPINGCSNDGRYRGPVIPLGEIAFIPGLPASVAAISAERGETATESVLEVAYSNAQLSFETAPDNASALTQGQRVELSDNRTGFAATSAVQSIGEAKDGVVRVGLEVPDGLSPDDVGRNFKAIVHLNDAAAVLNVPLGAILTDSDGSTYVHVLATDHEYFRLPVAVKRVDLGRAVIAEGSLEPGQLVVVGWYEP